MLTSMFARALHGRGADCGFMERVCFMKPVWFRKPMWFRKLMWLRKPMWFSRTMCFVRAENDRIAEVFLALFPTLPARSLRRIHPTANAFGAASDGSSLSVESERVASVVQA